MSIKLGSYMDKNTIINVGCKLAAYCSTEHQKNHWKDHKIDCKPFKVAHSDTAGRFLKATRDILSGSFILTESPIIVGPKWALDESERHLPVVPCVGCFTPTLVYSNSRCPHCKWPICTPNCPGLENDRLHKLECGVLAFGHAPKSEETEPEVVLNYYRHDALFALKCLMLQTHKPKKWEELMGLESHEKERSGSPLFE